MAAARARSRATHNRGNAETLRRYWAQGKGALKIRWGLPGDFNRCVRQVEKYMPGRAQGYCDLLHHRATGMWPAQHARLYRAGQRGRVGRKR